MRYVPAGLIARLTAQQLEAIEELEHQCDLISCVPHAYEVRWALERAGAAREICDVVGAEV